MAGRPQPHLAVVIMLRPLAVILAAWIALLGPDVRAQQHDLDDFVGTYLGYAEVWDAAGVSEGVREMTVMVEPYRRDGLSIRWMSIDLVDGRRDQAGVTFREDEVLLSHDDRDGFLSAETRYRPFEQERERRPLTGDVVRWAQLDGPDLIVWSFLVLADGRYELQRYNRRLTEDGMALEFERVIDGVVDRRSTGFARRVEP